jgi:hypothetical protein
MKMKNWAWTTFLACCWIGNLLSAQVDTLAEEEEDYSIYENLDFADGGAKSFCSNKITGLSPSKLISIGYDLQLGYDLNTDTLGDAQPASVPFSRAGGLRLAANVPVISRNDVIIQLGANYWETTYTATNPEEIDNPLALNLSQNGLRTTGLNTTIFKPFDETNFIVVQASADLNGDYSFGNIMPLQYLKYSAAVLYGKRPSDNKQWAIGAARTYRVGEMNYIPIVMFNYTDAANKWGTEILFPARAHVRRTFNPRQMLFAGYELEGQSYRLTRGPFAEDDLEIRRGELRFRMVYEQSIYNFIWISAQAGYRINYSYNVDELVDGQEFFRGFFGDQPYVMENTLTNPLYFQISLNLVSP